MPATNHLAGQLSPYLLQHVHNPVDWYPWGEVAFVRARTEKKPIFLSVGYATCHWCHVMERECFEDEEVAVLLNAHFISIKVDREERPDVDRLHMNYLLGTQGQGGWPMSVWLTPDRKPFYAGTYFPPDDMPGRPGFKTLLGRIAQLWATEPERVVAHAEGATAALAEPSDTAAGGPIVADAWRAEAVRALGQVHNPAQGGFGGAPKFPNASFLQFLLDYRLQGGEPALRAVAGEMALGTLRHIVDGGIRDHIGGGFHRYAVDERWRLPHFEKMLSDQALLTDVAVDAWLLSGDASFRRAAEECLDYLERRRRDPGGAWWTAEDADSPTAEGSREEGVFYLWTAEEIREALGADTATVFAHAYGFAPEGNLAEVGGAEFAGRNLPFRARSTLETAAACHLDVDATAALLDTALHRLRAVRDARPAPDSDDKILGAWNGLTLTAFARAGFHFRAPRWIDAARRAALFLRAEMREPGTGRLLRAWRRGVRGVPGLPEDYSFLVQGLLDLFAADPDCGWLEWALELQETQDSLFHDAERGGYFASAADDPHLLARLKPTSDGAEPAAVSVAVRNKARLAALLHRPAWRESARLDVASLAGRLAEHPTALPALLAALPWAEGPERQLILVGEPATPETEAFLAELQGRALPRLNLLRLHSGNREFFARQDEFFRSLPAAPGRTRAYLCANFMCQVPAETPEDLRAQLDTLQTDARAKA